MGLEILGLLPPDHLIIAIDMDENGTRRVEMSGSGQQAQDAVKAMSSQATRQQL